MRRWRNVLSNFSLTLVLIFLIVFPNSRKLSVMHCLRSLNLNKILQTGQEVLKKVQWCTQVRISEGHHWLPPSFLGGHLKFLRAMS